MRKAIVWVFLAGASVAAGSGCCPAVRDARQPSEVSGGDRRDPVLVMDEAAQHAKAGRFERALDGYLYCLDHGADVSPESIGVIATDVPKEIVSLGRAYPPALVALRQREVAWKKRIADGSLEGPSIALYLASVNADGRGDQALEAFDAVVVLGPSADRTRLPLYVGLVEQLYSAAKYPDVVRDADVLLLMIGPEDSPDGRWVRRASLAFSAYLRLNQPEAAASFAQRLIEVAPFTSTYAILIQVARSDRSALLVDSLRGKARGALSEGAWQDLEEMIDLEKMGEGSER